MNNDELLGKIAEFLNPIANDISQMKTDISLVKTELLHVKSAVDALKGGQDDLRDGQQHIREALAQKAEKADIHRVEQKLDKSNKHLQDHEARLEALEEANRSTHKN
jgi:archaellum component FlaC